MENNNNTKSIKVRVKSQYGQQRIFPVCDTAKLFARLTNSKILSQGEIAVIKQLGYTIEVEQVTL